MKTKTLTAEITEHFVATHNERRARGEGFVIVYGDGRATYDILDEDVAKFPRLAGHSWWTVKDGKGRTKKRP